MSYHRHYIGKVLPLPTPDPIQKYWWVQSLQYFADVKSAEEFGFVNYDRWQAPDAVGATFGISRGYDSQIYSYIYPSMTAWLQDNTEGLWRLGIKDRVFFEKHSDAMLFLMSNSIDLVAH